MVVVSVWARCCRNVVAVHEPTFYRPVIRYGEASECLVPAIRAHHDDLRNTGRDTYIVALTQGDFKQIR